MHLELFGLGDKILGRHKLEDCVVKMPDFAAAEWLGLSNRERAKRCRQLAEELRKLSLNGEPSLQGTHVEIARQWELLAEALEREPERAKDHVE